MEYEYVEGTRPYEPPWPSISIFNRGDLYQADYSDPTRSPAASLARLYPNVRGCGYPPELNCEEFYQTFKRNETDFPCWVSTTDTSVAITELDLERAKSEVLFSLIPLLIFIVFVLYAFCRMGVFAVCNPLKMCPDGPDSRVDLPSITPKKLLNYKRSLHSKSKSANNNDPSKDPDGDGDSSKGGDGGGSMGNGSGGTPSKDAPPGGLLDIPATIMEEDPDPSLIGDGKQVVTSAQVLPRKVSLASNTSQRSLLLNEEMTLLERELFAKKSSDADKSETNTIINELFGEELERMDRDRLASRYDVVDLKDLENYRDILNRGRTPLEDQRLSQRRPQPQHRRSWDKQTTDNMDDDEDFAKILADTSTTSTKQPPIRAKHL